MVHAHDQEQNISTKMVRASFGAVIGLDLHGFVDGWIGDLWGISRGWFLGMVFLGFLGVLWRLIPDLPAFAFAWVVGTAPIWVFPVALSGAWKSWLWYKRALYIATRKPVLLEVKMAREIVKSPRAMEMALAQLWFDAGETTFYHRVWKGQVRPYFSFEIASFGGDVRFYIWVWEPYRSALEAAMYAQYPEIELVEAEDYATKFEYDSEVHSVFCTDWRYEPKSDAYPIRTYVEFELDKDPKEEYKADPLAQPLEFLSSIKPDEQVWMQIIITMCKDVRRKPGGKWWETESRYEGMIKDEIDKIRRETVGDSEKEKWRSFVRIQQYRQTEQIRTMDRNMGKHPFNVGARAVYISSPEHFGPGGYMTTRWIWRPVGNAQWLNQMRPRRWHNPFDYPWQDLWDMRWDLHARRFFDCFRRRSHFYPPYSLPHNMMSTEVIATLWHPPSGGVRTPGVQRIPAKKAAPPPNLPM